MKIVLLLSSLLALGAFAGSGDVARADECAALCQGQPRDSFAQPGSDENARWAACFSCRCRTNLGHFPRPEELKCSAATGPLERYRAKLDGGTVVGVEKIDPNGTDTSGCLNGGIAAAGCDLQSRFRRFTYEDGAVEFQLLCRKPNVHDDGYYEYLIIGHNQANGATCFWQARDSTFDGEAVPTLDLSNDDANLTKAKAYSRKFYTYSAGPSTCTSCHANDAFLWSPYFHSAWPMAQVLADPKVFRRIRKNRKYTLVTADQAVPQAVVHEDLTAPGGPMEADCGRCHRVNKGSYCGFAEQAVIRTELGLDQASGLAHAREFVNWMQPHAQPLSYYQDTASKLGSVCW